MIKWNKQRVKNLTLSFSKSASILFNKNALFNSSDKMIKMSIFTELLFPSKVETDNFIINVRLITKKILMLIYLKFEFENIYTF